MEKKGGTGNRNSGLGAHGCLRKKAPCGGRHGFAANGEEQSLRVWSKLRLKIELSWKLSTSERKDELTKGAQANIFEKERSGVIGRVGGSGVEPY